jgi:hypothetical protein
VAKGAAAFGSMAVLALAGGLMGCAAEHPSMLLGRLPANETPAISHAALAPPAQDRTRELPDQAGDSTASSESTLASSRQHPVYASNSSRISKQDVIDWTARGVREDVVLERINRCGNLPRLTAADENQMRDAGVSETVIQELRAAARR